MRLADALGLPWEESFDPDSSEHADLYGSLRDGLYGFLCAGGKLSLTDWCGFSMLEREAAVSAGDSLRAIQAAATGLSAQGYHSTIMAVADGGDSLVADNLDAILDHMERATK